MASQIINNQAAAAQAQQEEEKVEVVTVTETEKVSPEEVISKLLYRKYKESIVKHINRVYIINIREKVIL